MEGLGASIYAISIDIGAEDTHITLFGALEHLSLPLFLGVIHASGILEDSLLIETTLDSFAQVLSLKTSGAIALHRAFPSGPLDFFILYSSIGEFVGTSGQSSYASSNSFLDVLATHRRNQGDNAVAFQWTAWRSLGMATATNFLTIELESKGITHITRDKAFRAWQYVSKYNVDHAVVTRSLAFEEGEQNPCALLEEIVIRKPRAQNSSALEEPSQISASARPATTTDVKAWVEVKITNCVASVLKIANVEEIDTRVPLSGYGIDSVMTIGLRKELQSSLQVKVPQALMWNYPTIAAMTDWFLKQFEHSPES
jgi:6-methylsalicylic acid synthase